MTMSHSFIAMRRLDRGALRKILNSGTSTAACLAIMLGSATPLHAHEPRVSQAALCASIKAALLFMTPAEIEAKARRDGASEYWIARGKACKV